MTGNIACGDGSTLPDSLSVHIGEVDSLLEQATRTRRPTHLVIAPVELHRRNLKLRLSTANLPLDAFEFTGPVNVASQLLETMGRESRSLDRVDRLSLLNDLLSAENEATERFRMILGGEPAQNAKAVEQARTEIETVTNYHPARVDAFRQTAESVPYPIDTDAEDVLTGTLAVERELRRRTSKATADGHVIRRATRELSATDGAVWGEAYPSVEQVAVVGLSSVPAPLADLVTVLTRTCGVEVHLSLRNGSGPFLVQRLPDLIGVADPGEVVVG